MNSMPTTYREHLHRERVEAKYQAVETLKALKQAWEETKEPDDEYIAHLARRIHKLENQLRVMRP
jgi:hypothetical protein